MNTSESLGDLARNAPLCPHEMTEWSGPVYPITNVLTGSMIGAMGFCRVCGGRRRQMFDTDPRQYAGQDRGDMSGGAHGTATDTGERTT